jgi:DNA-binding CsgD family transcriptional regulator
MDSWEPDMTTPALHRFLSKADLVAVLDVIDTSLSTTTEEQFHGLIRSFSTLVPVEGAHISVADLDESSAIVRSSRQTSIDFPNSWLSTYREQRYYTIDPVASKLFSANEPMVWRDVRARYKSKSARTFYGRAAEFGLKEGLSFGSRFARTPSASFFTCVGDELTRNPRHLAIVHYLLPHLHAALSKVHLGMLKTMPKLTRQELVVLNWAKYGKTNWEISLSMNISERTVKFHVENAIRKLQSANRAQAIAIALSQGLIDWG